jgi:hypothetical protein
MIPLGRCPVFVTPRLAGRKSWARTYRPGSVSVPRDSQASCADVPPERAYNIIILAK